jgi:hypothetical protein
MRIRMERQITGTRDGARWPTVGEEVELPDSEAADLCASGLAIPVVEDVTEKAVAPEPEKRSPGRPRKDAS